MLTNLTQLFPKLNPTGGFTRTSLSTDDYNCLAWAAGVDTEWWEPDPFGLFKWPDGVPRACTLSTYIALYKKCGFRICRTADLEPGFEKVALYLKGGVPKHAARQLEDGKWSSKLGRDDDISHHLDGLNGDQYGTHSVYLRRKRAK